VAELTGQTFANFEVVAKLGEGGMGAVYKARQPLLDRFVALKVMSQQLSSDPAYIARFIREAASAAKLTHPNMVQVYSAGEQGGIYYIVMEFVEGESLRDRLLHAGHLDPIQAIAIAIYVAQALQTAWNKAHLIHRDIKPDNIFLSKDGEVKVGDLGLAKSVGGGDTEMTQSGMMMGSPHYISPEQARASKETDFRTDIYSLGCTLYQLLTGKTPYQADEVMALILKHVTDPTPNILEVMPECPPALAALVAKMMAKAAGERHASYEELIADLWRVSDVVQQALSAATAVITPIPAEAVATLKPTVAKVGTLMPTVVRESKPVIRDSRLVMGGVVAAAALLVGLFLWSPWKTSSTALVPPETSGIADAAWKNAINLLPLVDPQKDAVDGIWTSQNGELAVGNTPLARLEIPYEPPEEYDFRITFTRLAGQEGVTQILTKSGNSFAWVVGFEKNSIAAFGMINGRSGGSRENPTRNRRKAWIENKRSYTMLIAVRNNGLKAFLNDELIAEWKTDYSDMSIKGDWRLRNPKRLGVATGSGETLFHRIEVREVTGKGTFTRGTPSTTSNTPSLQHSISPAASSAAALKLLGNVFTNSVGAEMIYIPPGEFMMGSTKEEQSWALANGSLKEDDVKREGEAPRKAIIKQGFWMGRTEVTVGQWKQFVKETGYVTDGEKKGVPDERPKVEEKFTLLGDKSWRDPNLGFELQDDHPMCCVSWNDSKAFCDWLTERERKAGRLPVVCVARLPTEAEWEYSCRAGTQSKYWWGENKDDGKGRLNWSGKEDGFEFVSPVDSFGKLGRNQFGLADMLGGVWEWCLDEYDATQAHEECYRGNPGTQVMRGGAFGYPFNGCRCAFRRPSKSDGSLCVYGFRVCYGVDVSVTPTTTSASPAAAQKEGGILAPAETRVPALTTNPKVGEIFTLNVGSNVTMDLMGIPPGEFMLGSTKEEQAWAVVANGQQEDKVKPEGEVPHKATIKQGFWMGRTEVTVGQWKQFVKETGYVTDGEKKGESYVPAPGKSVPKKGLGWRNPDFGFELQDDHPVSCISWNDAVAFCEWLTEREQKAGRLVAGTVVRLPTEAEWEYACRAGRQTKFWWGDSREDDKGRLNWAGKDDGFEFVAPVDSYDARGRNRLGLADMLGNVFEWCLDEFDATQAHEDLWTGNPGQRVLRGGSFDNSPTYCRCAGRHNRNPFISNIRNGFRVAVGPAR